MKKPSQIVFLLLTHWSHAMRVLYLQLHQTFLYPKQLCYQFGNKFNLLSLFGVTSCLRLDGFGPFKWLLFWRVDRKPNIGVGFNYQRFGPPLACGGWYYGPISQCHKYNTSTRSWVQVSCITYLKNLAYPWHLTLLKFDLMFRHIKRHLNLLV